MDNLPEQIVKRIEAETNNFAPFPERTEEMSDKEWDDIISIVGNQRLSYKMDNYE